MGLMSCLSCSFKVLFGLSLLLLFLPGIPPHVNFSSMHPKCSMCLNPIWEDDVLKKCLLHRKCISRSTLAWNPVGCRECKKMGAASISVENVFALAVTKDVCQWIDNRIYPVKPLVGSLAKNNILDDAERLYEGYLHGPESIASRANYEIFVSVHGGNIVRIWGKNYENSQVVAKIGPECAGYWEEHICGRPLGLRFGNDGRLLVADSYLGIFSLDVDTGKKVQLVNPSESIGGLKPMLIDDLDMDAAGNIYWSDASSSASLANSLIELVSDPSGRLIKYDSKSKKNSVLLDNLHFGNGVQVSPDESFVLISETFKYRVLRYWIRGPKAGSSDIFVSGLPGMPDNIRPRKEGGYYVSIVAPHNEDSQRIFAILAKLPYLRKLITRSLYLSQWIFDSLNSYFPNEISGRASFWIFNFNMFSGFLRTDTCIIVELNEDGEIIGSLQGYSGRLTDIAETARVGDSLFFGSPFNHYLGRLTLGKTSTTPSTTQTKQEKANVKDEL